MEQPSSKAWQLATLVVPVILAGWLIYVFSRSEVRVKQELDSRNQQLSGQLTLSTELFKRRFDAYETLYTQLINVNEKLLLQEANSAANQSKSKNVRKVAATNRQTGDLLAQLDKLNQQNALNLSDEVFNLMVYALKPGVERNSNVLYHKVYQVDER